MDQGMRFAEIGHQLRSYRMESGLRAEEIAARLGVSRAALYRYEKGEVIKLDTVKRMAELLKISPLSLLGIGVEYYARSVGYFERIRQIEEGADQILHAASGATSFLTTSDAYDDALARSLAASVDRAGTERMAAQITADQTVALLTARKQAFRARRPGIITMISAQAVRHFLEHGLLPGIDLPAPLRERNRRIATLEMGRVAELMETEPMGLQFGLITTAEPSSSFIVLRNRERAMLAINPFRADCAPTHQTGVAMVTGADEAVATHQRLAETMWRDALRGRSAASAIRALVDAHGLPPEDAPEDSPGDTQDNELRNEPGNAREETPERARGVA